MGCSALHERFYRSQNSKNPYAFNTPPSYPRTLQYVALPIYWPIVLTSSAIYRPTPRVAKTISCTPATSLLRAFHVTPQRRSMSEFDAYISNGRKRDFNQSLANGNAWG